VSGGSEIAVQESLPGTITRRDAARLLISAAASGLVLPVFASEHSAWHHIAGATVSSSEEAALASASWKPLVLSIAQEEELRVLSEAMLAGSTKAFVSRFIDLLLSVETDVTQKKFLGSLAAMDEEASEKFGKPFSKLTAQEQASLLSSVSRAPRSGDMTSAMRGHFEDLKEWIVPAYYSSEVGMRELGWTPDRVFGSYPTCTHAETDS